MYREKTHPAIPTYTYIVMFVTAILSTFRVATFKRSPILYNPNTPS